MGRTARTRRTPHLPPVERIELNAKTSKGRVALVAILLVGGLALVINALMSLLTANAGWNEIAVNQTDEPSCASEFVLLYNLGASGAAAPVENRAIAALYTQACVDAYRLFTGDLGYYGVNNVYSLNRHPNEPLEVDSALYSAFEQLASSGDRTLYLAPIYDAYHGLFTCETDEQTADFDPYANDELRAFFAEVAAFARDPEMIDLRLLGDGQVELFVSDAYLAFAEREEIDRYIDFSFMKNAFIADYLAGALAGGGYTLGTLSSYDGFIRCLDGQSDTAYTLNLYDRDGLSVYPAAVMRYSGARAICSLRNYPLSELDTYRIRELSFGPTRTTYLDVRDGLSRSALDELVLTSRDMGCAELLLRAIPIYIADALDAGALSALAREGADSVVIEDRTVRCTDPSLTVSQLYASDAVQYTLEYVQ